MLNRDSLLMFVLATEAAARSLLLEEEVAKVFYLNAVHCKFLSMNAALLFLSIMGRPIREGCP